MFYGSGVIALCLLLHFHSLAAAFGITRAEQVSSMFCCSAAMPRFNHAGLGCLTDFMKYQNYVFTQECLKQYKIHYERNGYFLFSLCVLYVCYF